MKKWFSMIVVSLLILLYSCSFVQTESVNRNLFFFNEGVLKAKYKSSFSFFTDDSLPSEVELLVIELSRFESGVLYELKINYEENFASRDYNGWDRFHIGYFYVEEDKITMIRHSDVLEERKVVCQEEEKEDVLNKDEKGWHEYILADDNRREYQGYNNLTETGFYETFVWEKGKGLVEYRSGFGAEKDGVWLKLISYAGL